MKKTLILAASLLSFVFLSFQGCQKTGEATGHLSILITDAPFPFDLIDAATVTITKVELRQEGELEDDPFMTVWEGSEEFNLLELRNGVVQELTEVEVPAGAYNLIRIYVEDAGIVVSGDATYSLKVPSGSQTGIKMFVAPSLQVSGGLTEEVLLDFNLGKSFVLKGNLKSPEGINGFNFKPVIRAVNNTKAGTIFGVVSDTDQLPMEGVAVQIVLDGIENIAQTDETGSYAITGIPAGTYTLTASAEGFKPLTVEDVEVLEGNKTQLDFVLESEVSTAPAN